MDQVNGDHDVLFVIAKDSIHEFELVMEVRKGMFYTYDKSHRGIMTFDGMLLIKQKNNGWS